jgi:hypothetical protein
MNTVQLSSKSLLVSFLRARECSAVVLDTFTRYLFTGTWTQYRCSRNLQPPSVYVHMNTVQSSSKPSPVSCLRARECIAIVLETFARFLLTESVYVKNLGICSSFSKTIMRPQQEVTAARGIEVIRRGIEDISLRYAGTSYVNTKYL